MKESERRRLLSPIVLGVAGYTRLRPGDGPALTQAVERLLAELRASYPTTPLVLVSSLAEGADRICAEAALAAGIEVIAPLPFPVELYAARGRTPAVQEELRRLAAHPGVTAFCPGGAADFSALIADERRRRQRYAEVAGFVARHSHALIALWDGEAGAPATLTAQLVAYKTQGFSPAEAERDFPPAEPGVVYSIFAPRPEWVPGDGRTPGDLKIISPANDDAVGLDILFAQTCRLTEELNAALAGSSPPARNDLAPEGSAGTPIENDLAGFRRLVADRSYRCKAKVNFAYDGVFVAVFLGAVALHQYEHAAESAGREAESGPIWFWVAAVLFLVATVAPWIRRTRGLEDRALDYRALAEALRVQFYWHHAGLAEWVPDHYLRYQRSELAWIRQATRSWALRLQAEGPVPAAEIARLRAVVQKWFDGQTAFHAKGWRDNHRAHQRWRLIARAALVLAVGLSGVLIAGTFAGERWGWDLSIVHPAKTVSVPFVIGLALLTAAMAVAYAEKHLFAEHARHFRAMLGLYREAKAQAERHLAAGRSAEVQALLQEMGEEALDENTEWLILHRVRHFEVPAAG